MLEGGYKSYRKAVMSSLHEFAMRMKIIKIAGRTGTGKTEIIGELCKQGRNVIDLEKLGSPPWQSIEAYPEEEQPSQKLFETLLWSHLKTLNPDQPYLLRQRARKLGESKFPILCGK